MFFAPKCSTPFFSLRQLYIISRMAFTCSMCGKSQRKKFNHSRHEKKCNGILKVHRLHLWKVERPLDCPFLNEPMKFKSFTQLGKHLYFLHRDLSKEELAQQGINKESINRYGDKKKMGVKAYCIQKNKYIKHTLNVADNKDILGNTIVINEDLETVINNREIFAIEKEELKMRKYHKEIDGDNMLTEEEELFERNFSNMFKL